MPSDPLTGPNAIEPTLQEPDPTDAEPVPVILSLEEQLTRMREDWDRRAADNGRYYVNTACMQWTDEDFFASGEQTVQAYILNDLINICQGKTPGEMRVLEIGCGLGRVTRSLGRLFGEVHAVDVSGEMVHRARSTVADFPNAFIYQNNGMDLAVVPELPFDFAFTCLVFQHIPSREVIQSYVREVFRLLRPGSLFKFQLQGNPKADSKPGDTWVGVPFSEDQVIQMASECGFESRYRAGAGTQDFWNWFFKPIQQTGEYIALCNSTFLSS